MAKRKRCRNKACYALFTPRNSLQIACGFDCAVLLAQTPKGKDHRLKAVKRETRAMIEAIKPKAKWAKEAQAAFNKYIRARDSLLPCISCQRHHSGQYHAGHYLSVGSMPVLRFEETNCHRQCAPCNNHLSGNIVLYRVNLIVKIGQKQVDYLEGPHEPKRYRIDDLKEIKAHYNKLSKELEKNGND